jgi:hypothetical protein
MDGIALTEYQRSMLCWLEATDGLPPRNEGLQKSNPQLAHEIMLTLTNLGLVCKAESVPGGWRRRPTELGLALVLTIRYSKSGCPACVSTHCVCRLKLVCVAGCGNAGCQGSHD